MSEYLNTLTVKTLREIAKQIGFRFISRYRKAELVNLLLAEIDACHTEAIQEDKIRTRQNAPTVSHFDFPVPDGRPVTEAHVKICAQRGHGYYFKEDVHQGYCPRCGIFTMIVDGKLMAVVQDGAPETVVATSGDAKNLIDSKEFPMDHGQFCSWFRRHGDDFEAETAIITDHVEALTTQEPEDLKSFLAESLAALKPLAERATSTEAALWDADEWDAEKWTTVAKDLRTAVDNIKWMINYIHVCSFQWEVGMSGCSYGCKIYRCETCGTDKEIHNATYGCRS